MFWTTKVECDGCNAKIPKKGSLFHRGSYFCNLEHLQEWERRNPPKIASGDPARLKLDLVNAIDAALYELQQINPNADVDQIVMSFAPIVGKTNAAIDAQVHYERTTRFAQHTHECIPIVRALGYPEVAVLERFGFGAPMAHVVEALHQVRSRATQP